MILDSTDNTRTIVTSEKAFHICARNPEYCIVSTLDDGSEIHLFWNKDAGFVAHGPQMRCVDHHCTADKRCGKEGFCDASCDGCPKHKRIVL